MSEESTTPASESTWTANTSEPSTSAETANFSERYSEILGKVNETLDKVGAKPVVSGKLLEFLQLSLLPKF